MRNRLLALLLAITILHVPAFAQEWFCDYGPNRDDAPWRLAANKGGSTNPVVWKMIYIRFSTTSYTVNRNLLQSTCESLFGNQSGGLHNVRCDVVTSPDGTQVEWVVPQLPYFEYSGDYGDASNVLQHGEFLDCWANSSSYGHTGELLARVLAQIQASYDAYHGGSTSTWTSPLADGDAVMFVIIPDSEFPPGESRDAQNPIRSGVGGVGGTTVLTATNNVNVVKILNGAPSGASGYLFGTVSFPVKWTVPR